MASAAETWRRSCPRQTRRREAFPVRQACRTCVAGPSTTGPTPPATAPCMAIDPSTGEPKWKFPMTDVTDTGIVTTASDLLFTGGREGYLQALDARTGTLLWKTNLGAQMLNNPITYAVNGKQYVCRHGRVDAVYIRTAELGVQGLMVMTVSLAATLAFSSVPRMRASTRRT